MAPTSPRPEKNDNKHKMQNKPKDNVVKLLTRGKLSGKFAQHLFRELPPLVRVPLKNIVTEEDRARHTFIGFTKCGRYVLSYCKSTQGWTYAYHLYWWEFHLHSKLKLVRRVLLYVDYKGIITELYLTVCEWPNDDSKIAIFGSDASSTCVLFFTITPKPPSAPCSHCCPIPASATATLRTDTGRGLVLECLEHGYMLTRIDIDGTLVCQADLHMKKDKVILWDTQGSLIALGVSFCPDGDLRPKIFTAITPPPSGSGSTSSSPSSMVPQGSSVGRQRLTWSPSSSSSSSSTPPTSPWPLSSPQPTSPWPLSSPQKASLSEPTYVNYTHRHYCLPGVAEQDDIHFVVGEMLFTVTDLTGRELHISSGSDESPCVCVEQLTLRYGPLIKNVIRSGTWGRQISPCDYDYYDPVILEVCPETNQVIIDIGLLLVDAEEEPKEYRSNLQVSWDLNTGLCCTIGVGDLTEFNDITGDWKGSHRTSCEKTKCLIVPENSYVHCTSNKDLEEGLLADSERCTSIVF